MTLNNEDTYSTSQLQSVSVTADVFLSSTVASSSCLLINHGNKSRIPFPIWLVHKYTLVNITGNYNPNIGPNYLINISENVACAMIMNTLKLWGKLIADVSVMQLKQTNKELSSSNEFPIGFNLIIIDLIVYESKRWTDTLHGYFVCNLCEWCSKLLLQHC